MTKIVSEFIFLVGQFFFSRVQGWCSPFRKCKLDMSSTLQRCPYFQMPIQISNANTSVINLPIHIKTIVGEHVVFAVFYSPDCIRFSTTNKSVTSLFEALRYAVRVSNANIRITERTVADQMWFLNTNLGEFTVFTFFNRFTNARYNRFDDTIPFHESVHLNAAPNCRYRENANVIELPSKRIKTMAKVSIRMKTMTTLSIKQEEDEDESMWDPSASNREWNCQDLHSYITAHPSNAPTLTHILDWSRAHPLYANNCYACVFKHPTNNTNVELYMSESCLCSVVEYQKKLTEFKHSERYKSN